MNPPPQPPPPPPGMQPPPPGYTPYAAQPVGSYASWGQRFAAYLLNALPIIALYIVGFIFTIILGAISDALGLLMLLAVYLVAFAAALYTYYLDGQGQSPGKAIMGIRVVKEETGQPIGGGMGIARIFVKIIDSLACYLGWLWPLWDAKKQTLSDKVLGTIVVSGPKLEFMDAYKTLIPKKG